MVGIIEKDNVRLMGQHVENVVTKIIGPGNVKLRLNGSSQHLAPVGETMHPEVVADDLEVEAGEITVTAIELIHRSTATFQFARINH